MNTLKKLPVWTRTCTEEEYRNEKKGKQTPYKGKCPKANPGQFERCNDFATASKSAKASGTSVGLLAHRDNDIVILDVDVAAEGTANAVDLRQSDLQSLLREEPALKDKLGDLKTSYIPDTVLSFLEQHPTYARYSASGRGLHIYFRLSPEDATILNKQKLKYRAQNLAQGPFAGEIFWDTNFVVWGPRPHELSTKSKINFISLDDLTEIVPILGESPDNIHDIKTGASVKATGSSKSLAFIRNQLLRVPTKCNHEVMFAYQKFPNLASPPSNDYLHWVFVGNALAAEARNRVALYGDIKVEYDFYELFNEWSARDEEKYDESSVQEKWGSLTRSTRDKDEYSTVTINSLFKLAKNCGIDWPVKKLRMLKGQYVETNFPVTEELENFDAVLKFFKLEAKIDVYTSEVYVTGPEDVLKQSFLYEGTKITDGTTAALSAEQFIFSIVRICQRRAGYQGFKIRTGEVLSKYWLSMFSKQINPVKDWIESAAWDRVPRIDEYLDSYVFNTDDKTHVTIYRAYIKKMLMTMVAKNFLGRPVSCEGILILSGPQNCHKTTALEEILPPELSKYVSNSNITMLKSQQNKDASGEVTSRALIILDEVERALDSNQAASDLKNFVSRSVDTFRRWYDRETGNYNRMAVFAAATNLPELSLSRYGNRRIWFVPVTTIGTRSDGVLDGRGFRQQLFAELLHEFQEKKGDSTKPWELSAEEIAQTESLNSNIAAMSDIDYALVEVYDWDTPFDNDLFMKQSCTATGNIDQKKLNLCYREIGEYTLGSAPAIAKHLKDHMGASHPPKAAAIKHSLTDRVLKWLKDTPDIAGVKIDRSRGTVKLSNNGVYYVLPQRKV